LRDTTRFSPKEAARKRTQAQSTEIAELAYNEAQIGIKLDKRGQGVILPKVPYSLERKCMHSRPISLLFLSFGFVLAANPVSVHAACTLSEWEEAPVACSGAKTECQISEWADKPRHCAREVVDLEAKKGGVGLSNRTFVMTGMASC
jgi:hypothetical protein